MSPLTELRLIFLLLFFYFLFFLFLLFFSVEVVHKSKDLEKKKFEVHKKAISVFSPRRRPFAYLLVVFPFFDYFCLLWFAMLNVFGRSFSLVFIFVFAFSSSSSSSSLLWSSFLAWTSSKIGSCGRGLISGHSGFYL